MHYDKISLLDVLADKAQCFYLSDIRFWYGKPEMRERLAAILMGIPAKSASLSEWNDALHYLTGISGAVNEEQAKAILTNYVRCLSCKVKTCT